MEILTTTTIILWPFVRDYPDEPVPEETSTDHPDHHPVFISLFHLLRSVASSLYKLHAWQSFCTTALRIVFGLPLGLGPPPHVPYISWKSQHTKIPWHGQP